MAPMIWQDGNRIQPAAVTVVSGYAGTHNGVVNRCYKNKIINPAFLVDNHGRLIVGWIIWENTLPKINQGMLVLLLEFSNLHCFLTGVSYKQLRKDPVLFIVF